MLLFLDFMYSIHYMDIIFYKYYKFYIKYRSETLPIIDI